MVRVVLIAVMACAALLPALEAAGASDRAAAAAAPGTDQVSRASGDGAEMPAILSKGDPSLARCAPRPRPVTLDALVALAMTLTGGSSDRSPLAIPADSPDVCDTSLFSLHCRLSI